MSVTLVGSPQALSPGYNPSVWYFNSTNKTQPGFRYYVEILNTSSVIVATYRYVPAITTGYAVVDLTKLLRNFVSKDSNTSKIQRVPNSWFGYVIKVYEEYQVPYVYQNYMTPDGILTELNATSNTHTFNVGDQIYVNQTDGGASRPMLQGIHNVISPTISGSSSVTIDTPWPGTVGTMGGSVTYADNRKTLSAVKYTSSTHYIFNGSLDFLSFRAYNMVDYDMSAGSAKVLFLTSMPRKNFYVYDTQDVRLNFANYLSGSQDVYFENDSGDKFNTINATTQVSQAVIAVNCGPQCGLTNTLVGSTPLVKPTTKYYDVWVQSSSTQRSEKIRFYIDRRCRIQEYEILFMDRMGSMNSFSFELRGDITNNNTKSTFKKLAGGLGTDAVGAAYAYATNDVGESTYNVDFYQTLSLNTNWLNDEMSVYFQELITSPVTYLKVAANTYVAVIVTTSSMVEKRQIDKKLIRYTIDVKFANNQMINI